MKQPDVLVSLSRRQFCGTVAGCVGLAALASCGGGGGGSPDATTVTDGTANGVCPATGAIDVGPPSMFVAGTPVYFQSGNFWVVRDANGLYALTARCTHEGATTVVRAGDFYCPRHGSLFTFDGAVVRGPATRPLTHFAMCTTASGNVGVQTTVTVAADVRLNV
jgi:Rieske Fe-S protein